MNGKGQWFRSNYRGIVVHILVQPQARKNEVVGIFGDPPRVKIRIASPPIDGKANETLVLFLKSKLGISKSQIQIVRGTTSKFKDILCTGLSLEEISVKLLE